jgi:predicted phage terminase large subunit-like protein
MAKAKSKSNFRIAPYSVDELVASMCRDSFWYFVQEMWMEVPGASELVPNWHMQLLCNEFQKSAERVFNGLRSDYDIVVNISPGTSKSTLASILLQAWTWTRMPTMKHITASHTESLALDLANKSRSVICSEKYRRYFPEVIINSTNASNFSNTLGGSRKSCTVGGKSPVGFHAHMIVVDDPIDPQKALSPASLQAANMFMTEVLPSRKVDKEVSVTFLIMQRLHIQDPTGLLLDKAKQGGLKVKHFCFPSELPATSQGYDASSVHPQELGEMYEDGLMDPVRLSRFVLDSYRITLGEYSYLGQFLQKPISPGGQMFKEEYFSNRVKASPFDLKRIRYWDRASTGGAGCATAGVLLGLSKDGKYYIEDVVAGHWEPDERNKKMLATAQKDRLRYGPSHEPLIYVEMEGGSSGRDAWLGIVREMAGFNIMEDRVTGDKARRAEPWSCQLAAGNVYLVDNGANEGVGVAGWDINAYITEHLLFPMGKYKDNVDASTGAFNLHANSKKVRPIRILSTSNKARTVRVLYCSREELISTPIENTALVLYIASPGRSLEIPPSQISKVLEQASVPFADLQPADYQDKWEQVVPEYNLLPSQLIMTPEHGKALWKVITRKRDTPPDIVVVVDDTDDRRSQSVAFAICDVLRLPRKTTIIRIAEDDNSDREGPALNKHVYEQMRSSRALVI